MKARSLFAVCALVCAMWTAVSHAQEQEEEEQPAPPPVEAAEEPQPAETPEATEQPASTKKHFGLYVYAGLGAADVDEFNTSVVTTSEHNAENFLEIESAENARFAIGWKLANKKGDFRLVFNGFAEDGYNYHSVGRHAALPASSGQGNTTVVDPLDWWFASINNGQLDAYRTPPQWSLNNDANGNGSVDRDEVVYSSVDLTTQRAVTTDLQNRWQNWDMIYGREWGPRRFQGRWYAGVRYFEYEGNILASAWLSTADPGDGYTDGSFLRLLNFSQESSGWGPTGYLEGRGNFFDQRLQVYLSGQAAFLMADVTTDTGEFFTLVRTTTAPIVLIPAQARLVEDRSKSIWNTNAEIGVRLKLKKGLEFDLAYQVQGYLDAVILPEQIQIPENTGQASLGVSAVYNTQDIVLTGWRLGVGFQF